MSFHPTDADELLAYVEQNAIKFVDLQFIDVVGVVKNITIPVTELPTAIQNGIWFDGSSIEAYARVAESDMHLCPDISTFAVTPWLNGEEATARLICDVFTPDGQPFAGDPRAMLKKVQTQAAEMGLYYNTGPELEYFLFKPNNDGKLLPLQPEDSGSYFDAPFNKSSGLSRQMASALDEFGIQVETMHHEIASGQHEIDFRYANALTTADNIVTFRVALKVIAQLNNLFASFLPKPIKGMAGSGMHVHQSLTYISTGKNAFYDPGDPYGLSTLAKQFIAGQLAHARGMCAVLAPLVNSYKRLYSGYEAPVYLTWARINRSALIRIPRANKPEASRIEIRCPDPSCNPYLAFTVMLAAGLDGIRRGLEAPEAAEENPYLPGVGIQRRAPLDYLPESLNRALDAFEEDDVIREALGPHIYDRFVNAKRLEWQEYRLEVTAWELEKYLSIY
ncbi:MAG: type I glutamate--ammonia ligase [Anaerolineae bacterium]|nr:type I glutamate--ammonia ligase [Anaerolineae bacterium]